MRKLLFSTIFVLAVMLSSCLTIEEEFTFKPNGSGTMRFGVDMSEMASLLNMAKESGSDELPMGSAMDELDMSDLGGKLKGLKGISNIQTSEDKKNYIFSVSCSFADLDALNRAMNALNSEGENHVYFKKEGNSIVMNHKTGSFDPSELIGEDDESGADYAMAMLESMKYKMTFNFKKPIQAVYASGETDYVGKKQRSVKIETSFKEMIENDEALNATIVIK